MMLLAMAVVLDLFVPHDLNFVRRGLGSECGFCETRMQTSRPKKVRGCTGPYYSYPYTR